VEVFIFHEIKMQWGFLPGQKSYWRIHAGMRLRGWHLTGGPELYVSCVASIKTGGTQK
jgi:hypothetical protein